MKYGEKRALNNDVRRSRTCQQCAKEYFKDKRRSMNIWNTSKFCSNLCSVKSRQIHTNSIARQTAFRRKRGRPALGSIESNEKVSRLTKLAMQRPEVQEKIRQPKGALSLERRMQISNNLAGKMPANLLYNSSGYSNIQRGYYDINGTTIFFRSKWEANYALYLDFLIDHKEIYKWEFEPETFMFENIKLGTRSYTPDFKVFLDESNFEYHEVKGYMDSKSKTKLKRFAKYYPQHKLILIDGKQYNLIKKQVGKLCGFFA